MASLETIPGADSFTKTARSRSEQSVRDVTFQLLLELGLNSLRQCGFDGRDLWAMGAVPRA